MVAVCRWTSADYQLFPLIVIFDRQKHRTLRLHDIEEIVHAYPFSCTPAERSEISLSVYQTIF